MRSWGRDGKAAHLEELFALDFPNKLHHNGLRECAVHQCKGIILIPGMQWQLCSQQHEPNVSALHVFIPARASQHKLWASRLSPHILENDEPFSRKAALRLKEFCLIGEGPSA